MSDRRYAGEQSTCYSGNAFAIYRSSKMRPTVSEEISM